MQQQFDEGVLQFKRQSGACSKRRHKSRTLSCALTQHMRRALQGCCTVQCLDRPRPGCLTPKAIIPQQPAVQHYSIACHCLGSRMLHPSSLDDLCVARTFSSHAVRCQGDADGCLFGKACNSVITLSFRVIRSVSLAWLNIKQEIGIAGLSDSEMVVKEVWTSMGVLHRLFLHNRHASTVDSYSRHS